MRREDQEQNNLWKQLFREVSEDEIKHTLEDLMIANDPEDHDESGFSRAIATENLRTDIGAEVDNFIDRIEHEDGN